ncbi:MAG: SDR family oxidoreductase [Aestuariivirga sp.]|nr:SDR family oxidoreductase [Aestuariivirga sp.]
MKLDSTISAVVTGGASGLGAATAKALAAHGVRVAIFDLSGEAAREVASEIGGVAATVDVTSDDSVSAGFLAARAAHGQERILVNCAGIVGGARTIARDRETGQISHARLDSFEQIIRVNLIGTYRCLSKSAAGMAELLPLGDDERGVIINTASIAATDGQIGQAAYAASKAGVVGLALPVARDLAGDCIRVNTILPGVIGTPMMAGIPQGIKERLEDAVPFPKRLGRPEEFASLVLEICRNPYLNAASIRLDGAIRMAAR